MKKIVRLKIKGLHCPSCVMNIDGGLEDLKGIMSANTNYLKSEIVVEFDSEKLKMDRIVSEIEDLGYEVILDRKIGNSKKSDSG